MSWLITAIATGTATFVATNIDDLLILTLFFAQVNTTFRQWQVIAGQYLGFTALIIASLPGFFGGLIVPRAWVGLLGLVPIAIGISHLLNWQKTTDEVKGVAARFDQVPNPSAFSAISGLLSPLTYRVAAVTFANGGDNIGIYVPLFASSNSARLGVILSVFFLLVGVWCCISYQLTRYQTIAQVLTRYGNALVPLVLISLGILILLESGTLTLLPQIR